MGLDMVPMGKPKAGYEKRFNQIFNILNNKEELSLSLFDRLRGKKLLDKEQLQREWFEIQTPSYETIDAPMVGRDPIANQWIKEKYHHSDKNLTEEEYIKQFKGYYVIELAKRTEGIAAYGSMAQDANAFRGQFLDKCIDIIGEDLVNEAWESKLSEDALDYGIRLAKVIDTFARERGLEHIKDVQEISEFDIDSIESKVHIIYCLSRWLIFYGSNGHGYLADY